MDTSMIPECSKYAYKISELPAVPMITVYEAGRPINVSSLDVVRARAQLDLR